MNARLALGAGCCLVCAAIGMLLIQPTTLPAQSGGGSQATLNNAVQRELDKLYTKNGKVPPQKSSQPSSPRRTTPPLIVQPKRTADKTAISANVVRKSQAAPRTSQPTIRGQATDANRNAKSKKKTSISTLRVLFSKLANIDKPLSTTKTASANRKPTSSPKQSRSRSTFASSNRLTYSNTARRSRKPAVRRNTSSSQTKRPSASLQAKRPTAIKRSVAESPKRIPTNVIQQTTDVAPGTRQSGNQSQILNELQKMYKLNGKQMPPQGVRRVPNTPQDPRAVGQGPATRPRPTAAAPQTAAAPRLLDRLFPWAKRAKRTPPAKQGATPQTRRILTVRRIQDQKERRAPNVLPPNIVRKQVQLPPQQQPVQQPFVVETKDNALPSLDGDIPVIESVKNSGEGKVAPKKSASNDDFPDLFPEPEDEESVPSLDGPPSSSNGLKLTDDDPKPKQNDKPSIPSLDNSQSPFSGLKLSDDNPKPDGIRSIPGLGEPSDPAEFTPNDKEEKVVDSKDEAESEGDQERKEKLKKIAARSERTGLKGFCPVALRDSRDLVDAVPEFSTVHGSKTFYFSSSDAKTKFDAAPQKYAPVNNGNDIVLLNSEKKEVEGSLDHAVWYKDRLHLFTSPTTLTSFVQEIAKKRAAEEAENSGEEAEEDETSEKDGEKDEETAKASSGDAPDAPADDKGSSKKTAKKTLERVKK
jgi:YHS domain-containing protein